MTITQPIVCTDCATAGHAANDCPDRTPDLPDAEGMLAVAELLEAAIPGVVEAVATILEVEEARGQVRNYACPPSMQAYKVGMQLSDALSSLDTHETTTTAMVRMTMRAAAASPENRANLLAVVSQLVVWVGPV